MSALRWAKVLRPSVLAGGLLIAGFGPAVASAAVVPTPMVDLGQASAYAVLSGASVGNTVNAPLGPHTTLRGDLGVKANAQPTGFGSGEGVVTGTIRVGNAAVAAAHADLVKAYDEVEARTGGVTLAGALGGATVAPGLHKIVGAASNTTTLTLNGGGDANAVFVFQVGGALAFTAGSHVVLTNGARASRVFWQVNGAGAIPANAGFAGTLMALDAVSVGNGSVVNGRAFARNGALTLDADQFYSAPPAVGITGGANAMTTDTTPTISGTTDVEAPGLVTVTVAGQTLTATPSDGTWSVPSAILPNGTYTVVASVTDGAGNPGSASQELTIDTVLPVVTLDRGLSVTTNDSTPTISGTSDAAVDTIVRVTVDSQHLRALVHAGGAWNIRPAALTDGTRTVTAFVTDPAGNEGTDSQNLTVDTAAPGVSIAGGANALTNDPTPSISGTADVMAGTTVTVTLADETLTSPVDGGRAWSVSASALADGPHRVVMSTFDTAGNAASFTQVLTVDTVAPAVAIGGGATAATTDVTPTIVGTSNAAPGTIVTVSIAGQAMTTLLQANGTWNATPAPVGQGAWDVLATAPDPAGNVGSARQTLTVATGASSGPGDTAQPGGTGSAGGTVQTPGTDPSVVGSVTPVPAPSGGGSPSPAATTTVARDAVQKVTGPVLSIGTKVSAPAKGAVVVTASGTVRIKGVKKAIKLASVTQRVAAGQTLTLKLKPSGSKKVANAAVLRIKSAIKKGTTVTATIRLKIVDAAGNTRYVKRTVKLTK
jgi:hypothetical protein